MRKPDFVCVTDIETTPEKLWRAPTSSELSSRYRWNTSVVSGGISKAWPAILSSLKSLLETGTALAIPLSGPSIKGVS